MSKYIPRNLLEEGAVWVLKIGLCTAVFIPLYISSSMLFPFITGKNFVFRILVEITAVLWGGLLVASPRYRPPLNSVVKTVTFFVVAIFVADILSPNPYRALFSNYERMEGFMMLGHLWLYFMMLISVFKTKRDWLIFFHMTLTASLIVAFVGLLQKLGLKVSLQGGYRVDSTIGNPAYLAAYLSLHIWLLMVLLKTFWKNILLRFSYLGVLLFELSIIYFTATRGALIALFGASLFLIFSSVVFLPRYFAGLKPYRLWGAAVLILVGLLPFFLWYARGTEFVQSSQVLNRLVSISLNDVTTQGRFSIWGMSLKGFGERPLLGWGQENYYLVFQKYFDPKLYASEPWFDRSHNLVFDWAIHGGVAGLFSFLMIFVVSGYTLFIEMRRRSIDAWIAVLMLAGLMSYFIQNLFVFDSLSTYLLFFIFLAFISYTIYLWKEEPEYASVPHLKNNQGAFFPFAQGKFIITAAILSILFFASFNYLHWKPIRASKLLIQGLSLFQSRAPFPNVMAVFKEALALNTFGTTEVREQMGTMVMSVISDGNYSDEEKKELVVLAREELQKEIAHPYKDVKHLLFLGAILSRAQILDSRYGPEAEILLKEALELSPTKQSLYFELAQLYASQGRLADATDVLKKAWLLEPNFNAAKVNLFMIASAAGKLDVMAEVFASIDIKTVDANNLERLGQIFIGLKDNVGAAKIYEELAFHRASLNGKHHMVFAEILFRLKDYEGAIREARRAAELDTSLKESAEQFIRAINEHM